LYTRTASKLSAKASDAETVRGIATSNKSFWQWRPSPTEFVKIGDWGCQTVWHYHSPADRKQAMTKVNEEQFVALIVGYLRLCCIQLEVIRMHPLSNMSDTC